MFDKFTGGRIYRRYRGDSFRHYRCEAESFHQSWTENSLDTDDCRIELDRAVVVLLYLLH